MANYYVNIIPRQGGAHEVHLAAGCPYPAYHEHRRSLGDRLGLHRPFEHGEGGKDSQGHERHGHGAIIVLVTARAEGGGSG